MKYNQLGTTDLRVSEICLGTMTFGEQNTEAEAHEQLDYALDHEVNFIDTAELYAIPRSEETVFSTERFIGTWLKNRKDRDQIILATKICGPAPGLEYIRDPQDFSPASIKSAIEGSLKRLQTDYIDLYQLHWPERGANNFSQRGFIYNPDEKWKDNIAEVVETLNEQVKVGNIRHYGISNETPWGMMRFLSESDQQNLARPVSIQNPYNLLNRTFEIGLSEMAIRERVGLLAYSPLAFGLLSGKYHLKTDQPQNRRNQFKQMARYESTQSWEATAKYLKIAQDFDLSLTSLALAYVNSRPFVTSNIIGATTMEQLKENIASTEVVMTAEMEEAIEAVQRVIPNPAP